MKHETGENDQMKTSKRYHPLLYYLLDIQFL